MTEAFRVLPDAIYTTGDLQIGLDLPQATIDRARREGRLRYTRQGHRVLYRGQWVIEWLESDAAKAGCSHE